MTEKIQLFTDSAADLPQAYKEKYGIEVVPLSVIFGAEEFKDQVTLSVHDFWQKLLNTDELPTTNQVNPHDFAQAFSPYLEEDYSIIYIGISARLSGTIQSACVAKELLQSDKIHIFDSKSASIGESLLLIKAAEMIEAGHTVPDILQALEKQRSEAFAYFTIDSLSHLVRGGRLTKTQGFLGSMLNIKPILRITSAGTIEPTEKVRSRKKALQTIIDRAKARNIDFSQRRMAVVHTYGAEAVREFTDLVQQQFEPAEIVQGLIGPTIGTHAGPGGIALFF